MEQRESLQSSNVSNAGESEGMGKLKKITWKSIKGIEYNYNATAATEKGKEVDK